MFLERFNNKLFFFVHNIERLFYIFVLVYFIIMQQHWLCQYIVRRLLHIVLPEGTVAKDYIYEQPAEKLLSTLLPRYVEVELYKAVLESTAAEHAARMTAMDSASSNAADVIERLTLVMNRVRQASITREIIEVVSGASALE